jgi:glycosyltransferase involved in cell wall biosynthesis
MLIKNKDFFSVTNNFAKIKKINSIQILKSNLDFIPKVTIAIPTYKRSNLLSEAINSVLKQNNYNNYDILVVDNNPERGCETEKLMTSFNDERINYFKNTVNIGMAGNWNRLFELAAGEYVVMLHDDDLLLIDFLQKVMKIIDCKPYIDILNPSFYTFYDNFKKNDLNQIPSLSKRISKINFFSFYSGNILGAPVGVVFKKNTFLESGGFNQDFYPSIDYSFFALFSKNHNIYKYEEYLGLYRYSQNESLKDETLNDFIKIDYFLVYSLLRKFYIPEFIIKNYLGFKLLKTIKLYQTVVNSNFKFDNQRLGWIATNNKLIGYFSTKLLSLINFILNINNLFFKEVNNR